MFLYFYFSFYNVNMWIYECWWLWNCETTENLSDSVKDITSEVSVWDICFYLFVYLFWIINISASVKYCSAIQNTNWKIPRYPECMQPFSMTQMLVLWEKQEFNETSLFLVVTMFTIKVTRVLYKSVIQVSNWIWRLWQQIPSTGEEPYFSSVSITGYLEFSVVELKPKL